jgi:hypothetical protein
MPMTASSLVLPALQGSIFLLSTGIIDAVISGGLFALKKRGASVVLINTAWPLIVIGGGLLLMLYLIHGPGLFNA